jgi:hypothetical protein
MVLSKKEIIIYFKGLIYDKLEGSISGNNDKVYV